MLPDCDKAGNDFSGKQARGRIVENISINYSALSVFWLCPSVCKTFFFPIPFLLIFNLYQDFLSAESKIRTKFSF